MKIIVVFLFFLSILLISRTIYFKNYKDNIILAAILLFAFAFNVSFSDQVYRIVGEDLKFYVNTATLILLSLRILLVRKKLFIFNYGYMFFIALFINIIYQYFFTDLITNRPMFVRLLLNYFSIFLCLDISENIEDISIMKVFRFINYLAIFNGVLGILQIITKKQLLIGNFNASILYTEGVVDSNRVVGIAGSNNSAGNLAVVLFVVAFFCLLLDKNWVSLLSVSVTLVFALLTQTRIALLAIFIAATLLFTLIKLNTRQQVLIKHIVFIIVSIVTIFIISVFSNKIIQVLITDRGNTQSSRFIQYANAWNIVIKNHFWNGIGTGQWRSFLYDNYGLVDIPIHSQYFNFWIENGFLIFILNILFNIWIVIHATIKKFIPYNIKIFLWVLFMSNFIVCNFNPNQYYTITNSLYYLIVFLVMNSKLNWYSGNDISYNI